MYNSCINRANQIGIIRGALLALHPEIGIIPPHSIALGGLVMLGRGNDDLPGFIHRWEPG